MPVKKTNKLLLKNKTLLHIDFFGFYNLIHVPRNTESLELSFYNFIEKNYCKKFMVPTFNYQFCNKLKTHHESKSEINSISDFFRENLAKWRSYDPIFSFCGNYKKDIKFRSKLNSFDKFSAIEDIIKDDGYYFFCGTPINFLTPGIHYLENTLETPYRYDKVFNGKYEINNKIKHIKYTYKVWPMSNKPLNYDSRKINQDLINAGVMKVLNHKFNYYIMYCKAREFNIFLKNKIDIDKLYLLDKKTKFWIKPMLKKLNRPFTINDFEKISSIN